MFTQVICSVQWFKYIKCNKWKFSTYPYLYLVLLLAIIIVPVPAKERLIQKGLLSKAHLSHWICWSHYYLPSFTPSKILNQPTSLTLKQRKTPLCIHFSDSDLKSRNGSSTSALLEKKNTTKPTTTSSSSSGHLLLLRPPLRRLESLVSIKRFLQKS